MPVFLRTCRLSSILLLLLGPLCLRAGPNRELILMEASWQGPNIIRVPFTLSGTLITVRARVDSVEGNFFFDTGAPQLLLNSRHFSRPGQAPTIRNGGVTGAVQVLGTAKIDTFQLDYLLKTKALADIIDPTHLERDEREILFQQLHCFSLKLKSYSDINFNRVLVWQYSTGCFSLSRFHNYL